MDPHQPRPMAPPETVRGFWTNGAARSVERARLDDRPAPAADEWAGDGPRPVGGERKGGPARPLLNHARGPSGDPPRPRAGGGPPRGCEPPYRAQVQGDAS